MRYFYKYFLFLLSFSLKEVESYEHKYRYDYSYSDIARGWFKTHVLPAIWADARLRCAMEGAELAAPTTNATKTAMMELIKESKLNLTFTGIQATFSPGDFNTFQGIPLTKLITLLKLKWDVKQPLNKGNKEGCIFMSKEGLIGDKDCNAVLPYICHRRGSLTTEHNVCGTVDKEYRLDRRTNKCYKFHTVPRNFSRAFLVCSAEGGHLAIINSVAENNILKELYNEYKGVRVDADYYEHNTFIGFHNWDEKFEWRTIHGQTLIDAGFNVWSDGEPNNKHPGEYCGAMHNSNGLLMDTACSRIQRFICEKHPRSLTNCNRDYEMKLQKGKRLSKENQKKERKRVDKLKLRNKYW